MSNDKWVPGQMDRRVYISTPNNTIDTNTKYVIKGWNAEVKVRAHVIEDIANEGEVEGGIIYKNVINVIVRYKSTYDSTLNKLKYKDLEYDVIGVSEIGRRKWLKLKCAYGGKELNR